jgi:hypothetical protein
MPAVIQTRSIKFGDGFIRDVDFLDLSGVGTGPWQPLSELTVGGALPLTYAFTGAGNTTPVQIKAGRGRLLAAHFFNYAGTTRYIKFYDKAVSPTVGTDVPFLQVAGATNNIAQVLAGFMHGFVFANGLWVSVTTGATIADTAAPAANDVVGQILYA